MPRIVLRGHVQTLALQFPNTLESLGLEGQRVSQTVVLYLRPRAGSALPGGRALSPSEAQWPGLSCDGPHQAAFLLGKQENL